jgi:hypothetical protein
VADDWHRRITPAQIINRAMSRLEKRGKGSILLLHDIHPATVAALPGLLKELKDRGYHIVQVVAPAPAEPETVGGPEVWPQASGLPDQIINNGARAAAWPQTNVNVATPDNTSGPQLPVPSVQDFGISLQGANAPWRRARPAVEPRRPLGLWRIPPRAVALSSPLGRHRWPTPTRRDTARWQHCERLRYEADLEPPRQLGARRHMRRGGH